MNTLRELMIASSHVRYLAWRMTQSKSCLTAQLLTGERLFIRPWPSTDLDVAHEVFVGKAYQCPRRLDTGTVRKVVDIGSNVGYTCLYWLREFPAAQVVAYEPHPTNAAMIRRHMHLSPHGSRVSLRPVAAGNRAALVYLTHAGARSAVTEVDKACVRVPMVDCLEELANEPIDVLKMDIEGGEYALLGDDRFGKLVVSALVLEWHNTPSHPCGREWCINRLSDLGYDVAEGVVYADGYGLLWAFRNPSRSFIGGNSVT
jgi:FkbM family methyltransferase